MPPRFPVADPGSPRTTATTWPRLAVLWWLVRSQPGRILGGVAVTGLWLGTQPLIPLFVGRAVDDGLSGGERRRLMPARALLTDAQTLILDEPTSAVDAQTDRRIARRLARHRRGRTTVVLTASPLRLAEAEEVVFVSDTLRSGSHAELLHDPRYAKAVQR